MSKFWRRVEQEIVTPESGWAIARNIIVLFLIVGFSLSIPAMVA